MLICYDSNISIQEYVCRVLWVSRYSVDEEWRVPHFEKMLYDQGQLLSSYVEAVQLCQTSSSQELQAYVPEYIAVIEGIVDCLVNEVDSDAGVDEQTAGLND